MPVRQNQPGSGNNSVKRKINYFISGHKKITRKCITEREGNHNIRVTEYQTNFADQRYN